MRRWSSVIVGLSLAGCFDPRALPPLAFAIDENDTWAFTTPLSALEPDEGRAFVTNNLDDTVSAFDLDRLFAGDAALLSTFPVGVVPVEREGPHHVAVDSDARFAYVGISNFVPRGGSGPHGVHGNGSADGHILKIDVDTGTTVDRVRISPNPGDVRLTPDNKTLLATHFDLLRIAEAQAAGITEGPELYASLSVIDVDTMRRRDGVTLCAAAHGMAISPDAAMVVASCIDDHVAVVELESVTVTRVPVLSEPGTARSPRCSPYAVTLVGDVAYVSCQLSGQLIPVDVRPSVAARPDDALQLPGAAIFGSVHDGILAVAHQNSDGVAFVDTTTAQIVGLRNLTGECFKPHTTLWSDEGSSLVVVCEGDQVTAGRVVVLLAQAPYPLLSSMEVGVFPDDIAAARRSR